MILVSNMIKFELIKEIGDKEGRYIMIKAKLENQIVTLLNVYTPPESRKTCFKKILDLINLESEGTLIMGGDFNVVLNNMFDTTSNEEGKKQINKYMNTMMSEINILDVWRELHPFEQDSTHHSVLPVLQN